MMSPDEFHRLQVAFGIMGAGLGFVAGMHARNRWQADAAPGLCSLAGGVLCFFAAFYLLTFALLAALATLLWFVSRHQSVWVPLLKPLLFPFRRRFQPRQALDRQISAEVDHFHARTEALLGKPLDPETKTRLLEQLERQHQQRLQQLIDQDHSSSQP